jgi:hypothetical protein
MGKFSIGDRVVWTRAVVDPRYKGAHGVVIDVVQPYSPTDDQFAMYEVRFEFGNATLYGTQIEAAATPTS